MLLDEPTASLDAANRETVLSLIEEAKARGAAIVGIFHDISARERVCDREIDVSLFTPATAA
jgi:alpha-D-ribose 1-methylphosphonate 5-triphosphate synthase subunit PhnL